MEPGVPAKKQEQVEASKGLLRLGDAGAAMKVQVALALLYYELHHKDTDVSVVQDDRLANDKSIRRAAETEWIGNEQDVVNDVTHPAAAFRAYTVKHPDQMVDIHDRNQLVGMLMEMGVDTAPPTLH